MANPIKGEVPLKLSDGRNLILLADNEALLQASIAYTGKASKLQKLFRDMQPEVDDEGAIVLDEDGDPAKDTLPATRALLFGALLAHQPDATLRDATDLLFREPERVGRALEAAITAAHPKVEEGGDNSGNETKKPTGKPSGRSGAKPT